MELVLDLGVLAAAGTAIVGFGGIIYGRALRPTYKMIAALHDLAQRELTNNGGNSLKDQMDRMEMSLATHLEVGHTVCDALEHRCNSLGILPTTREDDREA